MDFLDLIKKESLVVNTAVRPNLVTRLVVSCGRGVFPHHAFISVVGTLQNQANQNLFSTELIKNFFCNIIGGLNDDKRSERKCVNGINWN